MASGEQQALDNVDLQAVILDCSSLGESPDQLGHRLNRLRPELNLYGVVDPRLDQPVGSILDELFDRDDRNFNRVFRVTQAFLLKRSSTPFADTLRQYLYSAKDSWHTPGHSSGDSFRNSPWVSDFYQRMREHVFNADLSVSVQVLDSLQEPQSVIQESQQLAAQTFGATHTYVVTKGTSTANKVIVQHLLGGGGKILLDRGSHKSMHHAVILFGLEPVYLNSSIQPQYGLYGPVCKANIFAAIDDHPDAGLLVLTSCTYDGLYYDLSPIIEKSHAAGIKVLIDEAWYAHGRFHPSLRPNALDSGADYVTHSTHKMLSAFSQASMIHVNDPDFDEHRFRENLSPQYAMIASLDVVRKQMSMEGYKCLCRCLDMIGRLRTNINNTGTFRVLELIELLPAALQNDGIRLDPTKLTIDVSKSGMSGKEVEVALFEQSSTQVEKTTQNTVTVTVLVLVTIGATESKALRLIQAIQHLARKSKNRVAGKTIAITPLPPFTEMRQLPHSAYFGATVDLPLTGDNHGINPDIIGSISADEIVPYPPGIPLLVPGQLISRPLLDYLIKVIHSQTENEIHGLILRADEPFLRVVDPLSVPTD
jgi:arginine/lysine/ornithine decarboxylase